MPSKAEIEKARSILLRGNDIESAALILEAMILDNYIEVGGRVNILKVATRQIINFVNEYKTKDYLDVVREKVQANNRANQLEIDKQKKIEKIEERIKSIEKCYKELIEPYFSMDIGMINTSCMTKKEKEEFINKRNCLIVQKESFGEISKILKGEN